MALVAGVLLAACASRAPSPDATPTTSTPRPAATADASIAPSPGADAITVSDTSNTNDTLVAIDTDSVAAFHFQPLNFSQAESITYNGGSGVDNVVVTATALGVPVTVNGGGGGDNLILGNGNLDTIDAPVTLNGQGAVDAITVDDSAAAFSDAYTITPTTVTRPAGGFTTQR